MDNAELRKRAESGNRIFRSSTVLKLLDENERLREAQKGLKNLLERVLLTCLEADVNGDLPEIFTGELLDEMSNALKGGA